MRRRPEASRFGDLAFHVLLFTRVARTFCLVLRSVVRITMSVTTSKGVRDAAIQKHRPPLPPRPGASWLAGMLIGTAIVTMATQAMVLGAGVAIKDATLRGG